MLRKILVLTLALGAAGCGRSGPDNAEVMLNRMSVPAPDIAIDQSTTQQFAYNTTWSAQMAHDAVALRFERARRQCLQDKALQCKLSSANLSVGDGSPDSNSSGSIDVLLPRGKVDLFRKRLLAPVAGEATGGIRIQAETIRMDSVEVAGADLARKVAGLTVYRDKLAALAERPNLSIDDMIKLLAEQARVQDELDTALDSKRDIDRDVARERLHIDLLERVSTPGPIALVWRNAGEILVESTSSVLEFLVRLVPWLPVMGVGIFFLIRLLRLFRRPQKVIVPAEKPSGG